MIDKICLILTEKIKKEMPDVDEERAEVINYGLQIIIGEVPKMFITLAVAYLLGVIKLTLIMVILLLPYRAFSGGFHLKTHLGCIVGTILFYCGNVFISQNIVFEPIFLKYIVIALVWIFGMIMCKKYAPADTENVPILSKKDRQHKRKLSYITLSLSLIIAIIVPNNTISNILIIGMLMQSISISKIAYKLTKNKYGYEVYGMQ